MYARGFMKTVYESRRVSTPSKPQSSSVLVETWEVDTNQVITSFFLNDIQRKHYILSQQNLCYMIQKTTLYLQKYQLFHIWRNHMKDKLISLIVTSHNKGKEFCSPVFRNIANPKFWFIPRHVGMTPLYPCYSFTFRV
jgi:hypothetical protein